MNPIEKAQAELVDNFELFDDWVERYQYIISLGKKLPAFPAEKQTDDYIVRGCQSQVWFDSQLVDGKIVMQGTSDASIVKGLIAILFSVYNNQSPEDILQTPPDFIAKLGLEKHLSPTRSNGLFQVLKAIKKAAQEQI